jgi:DNA-binding beta-propeller fold protein YncE
MFQRLVALLFLTACTAGETDVAPPQYTFYYPTALKVSPSERSLFVMSANSDLRYSSGTVAVLNLDAVEALTEAWLSSHTPPAGCIQIADRPEIAQCPTADGDNPTSVMVPNATVQLGNFGVDLGLQRLYRGDAPSGRLRIFATVRGDPSITWIDFDEAAGEMDCGSPGIYTRCSPEHRLTRMRSDINLQSIPPEPFYLYVDGDSESVFAAHLTTGAVTLADSPRQEGSVPIVHDINQSFWGPVGPLGLVGAVAVAARTPGNPNGLVYVTSRREARITALRVAEGSPNPVGVACPSGSCPASFDCHAEDNLCHKSDGRPWKTLIPVLAFFFDGVPDSGFAGDARALAFSADGNRLYLVSRTPSSLKVFDTSIDATGAPRNDLIGVMEICDQPATLELADFGRGPRVILPCFLTGQVWVIDPLTFTIESIEDVGKGPTSVSVSLSRKRIYVANYAEDTLSVLDATPGARTEARMVLRIGTPRPVE